MPWRWVAWTLSAVLVVLAGVVLLTRVEVHPAGASARSCGSASDVVTGRTGWPEWWAQDLADPAGPGAARLVRTLDCPGAVNDRIVVAGALTIGAVLVVAAAEFVARRRTRRPGSAPSSAAARVRRLGTALTLLGSLLTVAGLLGIAVLVADPHSTLFVYVSRPVVVLAGLLLLLPAVVLIALGRSASVLADQLPGGEVRREDS